MNKKTQTKLTELKSERVVARFPEIDPKDLRRTVGGLRPSISSGQSTLNCDDWCDCD